MKKKTLCSFIVIFLVLILSVSSPVAAVAETLEADQLDWWQKTNVFEIYVNSFQDSQMEPHGCRFMMTIRSRML